VLLESFELLADSYCHIRGGIVLVIQQLFVKLEAAHVPAVDIGLHQFVVLIRQWLVRPILQHGLHAEGDIKQIVEGLEFLVEGVELGPLGRLLGEGLLSLVECLDFLSGIVNVLTQLHCVLDCIINGIDAIKKLYFFEGTLVTLETEQEVFLLLVKFLEESFFLYLNL
jgi:hypothetical protein